MDTKSARILYLVFALAAGAIVYFLLIIPSRERAVEVKDKEKKLEAEDFQRKATKISNKIKALATSIGDKAYQDIRNSVSKKFQGLMSPEDITLFARKAWEKIPDRDFLREAVNVFNSQHQDKIPSGFEVTWDGEVVIDSGRTKNPYKFKWKHHLNR